MLRGRCIEKEAAEARGFRELRLCGCAPSPKRARGTERPWRPEGCGHGWSNFSGRRRRRGDLFLRGFHKGFFVSKL